MPPIHALSCRNNERSLQVNIPPHTDEEFREIAVQRLTKEEGISTELANTIAKKHR
jgi:hypothetical protein